MRLPKGLGTFLGGFICAAILVWLVVLPKEQLSRFEYGFKNGELRGQMDVVDAIQKEFEVYDGHTPYKSLFRVHTSELISIETNGVKTIRVIP